jgi:release factor glutamine methyltransferase
VRDHDPLRALDGGPDGLDAYRAIAAGAGPLLAPGGLLALEIGAGPA